MNYKSLSSLCIIFLMLFVQRNMSGQQAPVVAPELLQQENILERLMEGNKRYVSDELKLCLDASVARNTSAEEQKPFAAILCCSDSRVPPEMVFDQTIGTLFIARIAGNLASNFVYGTLEYAANNLGVTFIMVLGHKRCGVMETFLKTIKEDQNLRGHIEELVLSVSPVVSNVKDFSHYSSDDLVRENVLYVVEQIKKAPPILSSLYAKGKLQVVGAVYDLDTGIVEILK